MTEIDWQQMPYFLAVVRGGSLRAAADRLDTSHGKVGRHLSALETTYGVRLFRRTKSGLELTEAGRTLIPIAEQAESLFHGARRRLQGLDKQEAGVVRFSLTGTMAYDIVSPILVRFFEAYPEIDLEISVGDRFEDINRLETDVSLRYAAEVTDDVVARRICRMAVGTFASRDYLERQLPHAGKGGAGLHLIGWDKADRHPDWVSASEFPAATVRHATTDPILQLNLARRGFGMIRTSVYFARAYPELVLVPDSKPTLDRSLWILLHSELRRTTRVRRFVDFLARELMKMKPLLQEGVP